MTNVLDVACAQFNIPGAGEGILAADNLPDVFAPPHHGPRNIPISVTLIGGAEYSYTHFPIVRSGVYAVYLDTADVFDALIYGGTNQDTGTGTGIASGPTDFNTCSEFKAGFVSSAEIIFNQNDPQPIAIRFKNLTSATPTIRYIVTLVS